MKTRSALSWFGSDSEVAPQLAAMLDHCKHVTIPFCGGLSILPHLKARAIVANDLHEHAINFYRVIGGRYGEIPRRDLMDAVDWTLSHPADLRDARQQIAMGSYASRAWAMWSQCWLGRKGKGGTDEPAKMPSVRWNANGGSNASRIKAAAADLRAWAKEFERCEFTQLDFRDVLVKVKDQPDCGIYCDPPWIGAGDGYLHSFTERDHVELAQALQRFERTTIVVRYGDNPFVRELYDGWRIIDASSRTQANSQCGEIWVTNKETRK